MKKKPGIDSIDIAAFQEAVKGTRRLHHNKIEPVPPAATSLRRKKSSKVDIELQETSDLPLVGSESALSYHQPGVAHKTLRNLRKGQYTVEAVLDLHGMTISEASVAVSHFLQQCISSEIRVVLIIHGKGKNEQPILKNKLNHWLRSITAVLAFCSASSTHGSRGAMYILLKAKHK